MIIKSKFLNAFSRIADTNASTDEEKLAHSFLLYLGLLMSIGGLIWGTISLCYGLILQSIFPFSYTVITLINFSYLSMSKNFKLVQIIQVFFSLLVPFLFQISLGGFFQSGGVILWSVLTVLASFTFEKKRNALSWVILYAFLVILSGFIDPYIHTFDISQIEVSNTLSSIFFTLNISLVSFVIFALFYYFVNQKEQLELKLHDLAHTDTLTKLPNRRYFFKNAQEEFSRSSRYDTPFSLLMLDIDFFKKVNDTYGHIIGDKVLVKFAELIQGLTRQTDIIGRYGGEEFIILLTQTPLPNADILAKRIVKECQDILIQTEDSSFNFTVSVGLTQVKKEDKTLSEVLKRADDALYEAKDRGRKQTYIL